MKTGVRGDSFDFPIAEYDQYLWRALQEVAVATAQSFKKWPTINIQRLLKFTPKVCFLKKATYV